MKASHLCLSLSRKIGLQNFPDMMSMVVRPVVFHVLNIPAMEMLLQETFHMGPS